MNRQRLLLASLLVVWVSMVLACGGVTYEPKAEDTKGVSRPAGKLHDNELLVS